jgi:RNA polymerase sigma factor (sigma-70 family)
MAKYRLDLIASLARQMAFTPLHVRDAQLQAAEELAISIDPAKAYPPAYVVFRITGYSPKDAKTELVTGLALQHDIGVLVEQVSDTLKQKTTDRAEPVLTIDDLTARFNVTSKTIQRWRRRGLTARRFVFPDGKRRVGFRLAIVERFLDSHKEAVERGANFSQVHDQERDLILIRARRLATQCRCCMNEISRRIARKLNRSPLTIQSTIRKHDAEHPADAIFAAAPPPMDDSERLQIIRIIRSGACLQRAASATGRRKTAVYRVVLDDRLARITDRRVKFIDDPLYHQPDAADMLDQMVRQETLEPAASVESTRVPSDLPPYLRELYRTPLLSPSRERALFLKYNFQKYQFVHARKKLDPAKVRARDIDHLESLLARSIETKNQIVQANLRLVVSVAKKHVRGGVSLMELVSEGNITLMRAVESFDVHKGNKFSTYATLALMKGYARAVPQMISQSHRAILSDTLNEMPAIGRLPDGVEMRDEVQALLSTLDDRERHVIATQFGMKDVEGDGTDALARELGVTRQRIRQIERSALDKLRDAAGISLS